MAEVPTLYDILTDERRSVTQTDVDRGQNCQAALGFWRTWQSHLTRLALEVGQGKIDVSEAEHRLRTWPPPRD